MRRDSSIARLFFSAVLLGLAFVHNAAVAAQSCSTDMPDEAPDSRYADNNDGTVTDLHTGLMWKKCVEGMTYSGDSGCLGTPDTLDWHSAVQRAASVNGGDAGEAFTYDDWYLPNIKELVSLHRPTCTQPAVNATIFPSQANAEVSGQVLWSSTPKWIDQPADQERRYHTFDEFGGDFRTRAASSLFNVRLVRDAIQEVVYYATEGSLDKLNVVNERGLNKRTIVESVENVSRVAVSSDFKKIAFIRAVPYFDPEENETIDYSELFIADTDGSNAINLSLSAQADEFGPVFSPDNARLAFIQRDESTSRHDIMVIGADGTGLVNVTAGVSPGSRSFFNLDLGSIGWSADATSIYYHSDEDFKVYSIAASGSGVPLAVSATGIFPSLSDMAFSPDGWSLAWVSALAGADPRDELYTMDLATGAITTIHQTQQYTLYSFAWSPDSSKIAIFDFPKTLKLVSADGSGVPEELWDLNSEFNQYYLRQLQWSPDGNKILFVAIDSITNDREIFVLDIETGETTNITNSEPAWDHYGTWLR